MKIKDIIDKLLRDLKSIEAKGTIGKDELNFTEIDIYIYHLLEYIESNGKD